MLRPTPAAAALCTQNPAHRYIADGLLLPLLFSQHGLQRLHPQRRLQDAARAKCTDHATGCTLLTPLDGRHSVLGGLHSLVLLVRDVCDTCRSQALNPWRLHLPGRQHGLLRLGWDGPTNPLRLRQTCAAAALCAQRSTHPSVVTDGLLLPLLFSQHRLQRLHPQRRLQDAARAKCTGHATGCALLTPLDGRHRALEVLRQAQQTLLPLLLHLSIELRHVSVPAVCASLQLL
jgi:hypothetical protein